MSRTYLSGDIAPVSVRHMLFPGVSIMTYCNECQMFVNPFAIGDGAVFNSSILSCPSVPIKNQSNSLDSDKLNEQSVVQANCQNVAGPFTTE